MGKINLFSSHSSSFVGWFVCKFNGQLRLIRIIQLISMFRTNLNWPLNSFDWKKCITKAGFYKISMYIIDVYQEETLS